MTILGSTLEETDRRLHPSLAASKFRMAVSGAPKDTPRISTLSWANREDELEDRVACEQHRGRCYTSPRAIRSLCINLQLVEHPLYWIGLTELARSVAMSCLLSGSRKE